MSVIKDLDINTSVNTPIISDLDDTLITYAHPPKFLPGVIKWLETQKHRKLIIVTNQKNVSNKKLAAIREKLAELRKILPVDCYISTGEDRYRKPNTGVFEDFIFENTGKNYVYIGDAAGRPGDFSDSDRKFAFNVDLWLQFKNAGRMGFKTPEAVFQGKTVKLPPLVKPEFSTSKNFVDIKTVEAVKKIPEPKLVIMCGVQGSGKSMLAHALGAELKIDVLSREKYNDDTYVYKTASALLKSMHTRSESEENMIIDTTGYSQKVRDSYVDALFDPKSYSIVVVNMDVSKQLAERLRAYRVRKGGAVIPKVAVNVFYSKYEPEKKYNVINAQPSLHFEGEDAVYFAQL